MSVALIYNPLFRSHRLLYSLYGELISSRALSSLPESHKPSLQTFRVPYPDVHTLDSSIFESTLFQGGKESGTKVFYHEPLLLAVQSGDFSRAEILRQELKRASLPPFPNHAFSNALKSAIQRATPEMRQTAFLNWLPFVPSLPGEDADEARKTLSTLVWGLLEVHRAEPSNWNNFITVGRHLIELGHVELVGRQIIPTIVRMVKARESLGFIQKLETAVFDCFDREGTPKDLIQSNLITLRSSAVYSYTLAGYLTVAFKFASKCFLDKVPPNDFSLLRLEKELRAANNPEILAELTGLRIEYLTKHGKVAEAARRFVMAHINSVDIPSRASEYLRQALRSGQARKEAHNVVHAIERAMRRKKESVATFRIEHGRPKGKEHAYFRRRITHRWRQNLPLLKVKIKLMPGSLESA